MSEMLLPLRAWFQRVFGKHPTPISEARKACREAHARLDAVLERSR